jgi:hypothetical protein
MSFCTTVSLSRRSVTRNYVVREIYATSKLKMSSCSKWLAAGLNSTSRLPYTDTDQLTSGVRCIIVWIISDVSRPDTRREILTHSARITAIILHYRLKPWSTRQESSLARVFVSRCHSFLEFAHQNKCLISQLSDHVPP